ncbi:MAG: NAD(P)/FAD-dependent oxidoreductase [Anaerolineae bacterium]
MTRTDYDVIIVGAGPAGIFAALELTNPLYREAGRTTCPRVLILDKGPALDKRRCPSRETGRCMKCATCALMTGWGGAGAFSDGKLTITTQVGGLLSAFRGQDEAELLVQEVDRLWVQFGADGEPYNGDLDRIEEVSRQAAIAGMRLQHYPIRHLGTERSGDILGAMYEELVSRGVDVRTRTEVARVQTAGSAVVGVETAKGEMLTAPYVVLTPGREGADWLTRLARDLNLSLSINPVDIGVRVELPAQILQPLTDLLYEPKFIYFSRSFDDRVRTFCVCPYGEVVIEWAGDVLTVNGHSYAEQRTENTNFAVLVSKNFTEPFKEPIAYGKYIARLANLLSGGIMVQRLGDLRAGRRTTEQRLERCITRPTLKEATPGDLNLVLPHRYVVNILEMLDALDQVAPGVASRHTLLYGVEAKFYSSRLQLSHDLETEVRNLFAAGDGAGVTRGLVQASASGLVVAREILRRR